MIGIVERRGDAFEQHLQPLLALDLRQLPQVLAILAEQIEGEEAQRALIAADAVLQRGEVRVAIPVQRDDLPVDQRVRVWTRASPPPTAISAR